MAAQKDTLAQTGTPKSSTPPLPPPSNRLLIAASGTGGHLFPALAVTQDLTDFQVEWLGVNNRLETHLVPAQYPLHTVPIEGFQQGLSPKTLMVLAKFLISILQTRRLLKQGQFQGVFTTGGYIAAPAIIAARSLGLPSILHESNALPGKVTRWLSRWCSTVALGFEAAVQHLPQANTVVVGTPVRKSFLQPQALDLPIPKEVPLIVVVGGSQGALAVNRLVRQCASTWLAENAWLVHLTGDHDRDVASFHPQTPASSPGTRLSSRCSCPASRRWRYRSWCRPGSPTASADRRVRQDRPTGTYCCCP